MDLAYCLIISNATTVYTVAGVSNVTLPLLLSIVLSGVYRGGRYTGIFPLMHSTPA